MEYEGWIDGERRFRIKILRDWPEARDDGIYRVCQECGEICICAELRCPNCDSTTIRKEKLDVSELLSGRRIRCRKRFENLSLVG